MDIPAEHLHLLEQMDRSLEDHTRDFLDLGCLTHYLDHSLCMFFNTGLNEWLEAYLPGVGPWGAFFEYVEWVE